MKIIKTKIDYNSEQLLTTEIKPEIQTVIQVRHSGGGIFTKIGGLIKGKERSLKFAEIDYLGVYQPRESKGTGRYGGRPVNLVRLSIFCGLKEYILQENLNELPIRKLAEEILPLLKCPLYYTRETSGISLRRNRKQFLPRQWDEIDLPYYELIVRKKPELSQTRHLPANNRYKIKVVQSGDSFEIKLRSPYIYTVLFDFKSLLKKIIKPALVISAIYTLIAMIVDFSLLKQLPDIFFSGALLVYLVLLFVAVVYSGIIVKADLTVKANPEELTVTETVAKTLINESPRSHQWSIPTASIEEIELKTSLAVPFFRFDGLFIISDRKVERINLDHKQAEPFYQSLQLAMFNLGRAIGPK